MVSTHRTGEEVPRSSGGPPAGLSRGRVRTLALDSGFEEAGVVSLPHPGEARDAGRFQDWIAQGYAGSMRYLSRTSDAGELLRARVATPFPWARSAVICLAVYNPAQPRSTDPAPSGSGWIARYAWTGRPGEGGRPRPSDYHKVLLARLRRLEALLRTEAGGEEGGLESRAYVDTGPLVERSLAVAAGLGWTGKNTCLIHPRLGSYTFLAVLLTSLPVEEGNAALVPDRCGSCRRCLDACPTGALIEPYRMDAARCISYLTIEHRGEIEPQLMDGMGRQLFGCDICQDVCPWNRRSPVSTDAELAARPELVNPALAWLAEMEEPEFERTFNGSPVRRAGFAGLRRNLAIAMGNSGLKAFRPRLREWAGAADEGLSAAARRALRKLDAGAVYNERTGNAG